jgi:imidazolonepropionase-like amidohydrolase
VISIRTMMRTVLGGLAAAAVAVQLAACAWFASGQPQTIVIEGGTIIDGTGAAPIENGVVVIEGSRITAVGPQATVTYPARPQIIRADGMTVLPGLIDAHIHSLDFFPPLFLRFGVTTVYDTANPTEWVIGQRDAIAKGQIKGPRMFVTGVVIDGPDSVPDRRDAYRVHVSSTEEARTAARDVLRRGADLLKVYQNLTPDLLKAIVDEAHGAGTEAVGHARDANEAIAAGLRFIEHATPIAHATLGDPAKLKAMDEGKLSTPEAHMNPGLFPPLVDLMVRNGVYFNPTLTRIWVTAMPKRHDWYREVVAFLESPAYRFIPAARREFWLATARGGDTVRPDDQEMKDGLRKVEEFTRLFAKAGGRIVAGPDSGPSSGPANLAGYAMHVEMEALVDAGLTPMQAILSATRWPAELLRKEKEFGTIAPGTLADVIVVEGNPLADIRATRNIRTVIMNGTVVDTTLDPRFRNPIPRPVHEYPMDRPAPPAD